MKHRFNPSLARTMMLLPVLAGFFIGFSAPQQHETNYQIVVQHVDPSNGYIDYVRATDLVQGLELDMCLSWSPSQYDELAAVKKGVETHPEDRSRSWSAADEARLAIAERLHQMDFLGVQRLAASKCDGAMALIRVGNQKKAWDPRDKSDVSTLYPEQIGFRKIANLIRAEAYVRFADGDTRTGTSDLLEGLTFCRRVGGVNILSELIAHSGEATLLAAFEDHLAQLSDKDAIQIAKYMDAALAETATYLQALQRERDEILASMDILLANPDIMLSHPKAQPEEIALAKYLKGITSGEREAVRAGASRGIGDAYGRLIAQIGQDESSWADKPTGDRPSPPPSITTPQDGAEAFARVVMPATDRITVAVLRTRAQLRLLDLHARIIDYKWQTNHLPTALKDAAPDQLIHDPLAKTAFQYEIKDSGYRLYSQGLPLTGPIELHYRRPANLPGDPNDPIPPGITK